MLSKSASNRLSTTINERLEPWDTITTLVDGHGFPEKIVLSGQIPNLLFRAEFLVSRISDKEILRMVFLAEQKYTLRLNKGVLVWGEDTIVLLDTDGRLLVNKTRQVLSATILLPGVEAQVSCKLFIEPSSPVECIQNYVRGYTGVAVAATVCQSGQGKQVFSCYHSGAYVATSVKVEPGSVEPFLKYPRRQ